MSGSAFAISIGAPFRLSPRDVPLVTILALDTSTNFGSVALFSEGRVLLDEAFSADRSHSATLFPILERARALSPRIERVAVGLGPGSYAGVRIAIAAALGFEVGLGARLLGLPSVAALAVGEAHYVAVGDARRSTFYFTELENGVCLDGPRLLDETALRETLSRCALPIYSSTPLPAFPEARVAQPSARRLAELAEAGRGIVATGDLEPIYLREPHITQPKRRD